jgi:hypothetical protein
MLHFTRCRRTAAHRHYVPASATIHLLCPSFIKCSLRLVGSLACLKEELAVYRRRAALFNLPDGILHAIAQALSQEDRVSPGCLGCLQSWHMV